LFYKINYFGTLFVSHKIRSNLGVLNFITMRNIILVCLIFLTALSCKDKKTNYEIDDEIIQNYLTKTGIEATKHSSGLYYVIEKEGIGEHPTLYDVVEVKYMAYSVDTFIFDKGTNPIIGPLTDFYQGWQIGIPLFSKGGKGKLFLPRNLANGRDVVLFDIELRNILK